MTKKEFNKVMRLNFYIRCKDDTPDVVTYFSSDRRVYIWYDISCEDLNVHVDDEHYMSVGNFSTDSFTKVNEFLKVCDMPQLLL